MNIFFYSPYSNNVAFVVFSGEKMTQKREPEGFCVKYTKGYKRIVPLWKSGMERGINTYIDSCTIEEHGTKLDSYAIMQGYTSLGPIIGLSHSIY